MRIGVITILSTLLGFSPAWAESPPEQGFAKLASSAKGDICLIHGTMKDKFPDGLAPNADATPAERKKPLVGGLLSPDQKNGQKNLKTDSEKTGYMIRLRFLVKSADLCKVVAQAYCRERDKDGFIPKELKANYRKRGAAEPSAFFSVLPNCSVVPAPQAAAVAQ